MRLLTRHDVEVVNVAGSGCCGSSVLHVGRNEEAIELAKRNITVNCVAPGLIDTDMVEPHVLEEALKVIPAKRMGKPEEVAATVSFLLGEEAAYITRQVISVNGGMV